MVKRIDFSRETPESRRIYVNQWDYGLILHITGIQAKEAHFAVEGSLDNALVVPLAEEGGILSANVPDRFLTQEREIYAYLYEETEEDGRTVGKVTIHVKPRAKPEDYIHTPEELKKYEELEEGIAGIREELEKLGRRGVIADFVFTEENLRAASPDPVFYGGVPSDYLSQAACAKTQNLAPYVFDAESGGLIFTSDQKAHLIVSIGNRTLLAGLSEFTVSYDCKSTGEFTKAWLCYLCPHDAAQSLETCDYIGILDYPDHVQVDRASQALPMDTYTAPDGTYAGWHHVDVVFRAHGTEVYINGVFMDIMHNPLNPTDLLKSGGVFYIGRANWGSGEYYDGIIKTFRVYNRALSAAEIAEDYAGRKERGEDVLTGKNQYGISIYRSGETYTYPTDENGDLFSGWFEDAALTKQLKDSGVAAGRYYAKFVDKNVLRVKYQRAVYDKEDGRVYNIRMYSTTDSLNYSGGGFIINNGDEEQKTFSRSVFDSYNGITPAQVGGENAKYLRVDTLENVSPGTILMVTSYWVTMDGTTVMGTAATIQVPQ